MDNVWLASALWLGLALAASVISIWTAMSVALVEIVVGAVAGNTIGLTQAPWANSTHEKCSSKLTSWAAIRSEPCRFRPVLGSVVK
jgi:hypothetical protein